jgi:hypothetical protein
MNRFRCFICLIFCVASASAQNLQISWTNNLLTLNGPNLPGKTLDIWYLEAFCRKGSTHQDWGKTTIPHQTKLLEASATRLKLLTTVGSGVTMTHVLTTTADEVDIRYELTNAGLEAAPIEWFQPACMRVERFTGCAQSNYTARSFIFTERGLTTLDQTKRTEEALYRGGQVYVPKGINLNDVNPRPLSGDSPTNGLIGCFSADNKYILATAFDRTHELFEGVYVCLHSDPHVGGLAPGETKAFHGKIYFMTNDIPALLKRYEADFRTPPSFRR